MTHYALDRAANYLRDDLKRYKIEVPEGKRQIIRRGMVTVVDPFTTYPACLKMLREKIREEKALVEKELLKNQGSLFDV